jgi:hypothetical protein
MQKIILASFLLAATQSIAQTLSPSTMNMGGGSEIVNGDFIIDWSIGESTSIETYYGDDLRNNRYVGRYWTVTSGVLQPLYKNYFFFNPFIPIWAVDEIRFYPVPTKDIVTIDINSTSTGKISIQLLDLNGKIMESKEFSQSNSNRKYAWDLSKRASGIYFFRIILVSSQSAILKQGTFKIEKIK